MLNNLFSAEVLQETLSIVQGQFLLAFWETLYVTIAAMFFAVVIGLPLGVILVVGEKGGLAPLPGWLMKTINVIINLLRSVPFLILMILLFPFTRAVVGTAVGTVASIVPLVVAAFPLCGPPGGEQPAGAQSQYHRNVPQYGRFPHADHH